MSQSRSRTILILLAIAWALVFAISCSGCKNAPKRPIERQDWRQAPPDGPDAPQQFDPEHGPNWGTWPAWPNWPEPQIV